MALAGPRGSRWGLGAAGEEVEIDSSAPQMTLKLVSSTALEARNLWFVTEPTTYTRI